MKQYLFYLFILIPIFVFSQFQRDFIEAEIHFKDGKILKGWIYDEFLQSDLRGKADEQGSKSWSGVTAGTIHPSRHANFPTVLKTIIFKENYEDGHQQKFTDDSIDFIETNRNTESFKYKTLNFIRPAIEKDGLTLKMDTINRNIWAPVIKEGKLNMYGYFTYSDYKRASWSEVYFKKDSDDFAYQIFLPYKLHSKENHSKLIQTAISNAFHDCPYMMNNIDQVSNLFLADLNIAFSAYSKEEGQEIKSYPKDQRDMIEYLILERRSYVPYQNLYNLYIQHCGQ
jgi:hypothetical protein